MIRLKAALKALSDSYPSESAIAEIRSPELVSLSPANSIRHRVKYSRNHGVVQFAPTVYAC